MSHARLLLPLLLVLASCQASPLPVTLHTAAASPLPAVTPRAVASSSTGTGAIAPPLAVATPAPAIAWPAPAHPPIDTQPSAAVPEVAPATVPPLGQPVALASPVSVADGVTPGLVIATLADGVAETAVLAAGGAAGFVKHDELLLGGHRVLALSTPPGVALAEAIARLRAIPGVTRAAADPIRRRQDFAFTHPDPRFGEQWAHRPDRGNTAVAWNLVPPPGQSKIIAAVLDTGLDVNHPEFAGRVLPGIDYSSDLLTPPTDVTDLDGHGTHVTGIVAAAGNNGIGVAGVAWGVQILPVKVLDANGAGSDFNILKGILFALNYIPVPDNGARVRVINLSLGGSDGEVSALWTAAIAQATAAGVVVVIASGNDGLEALGTPANTPGAVSVGSTSNYLDWETLSDFSNFSTQLELTAPGESILSTAPTLGSPLGKDYAYDSGTSMAAPFVTGVAALIAARYDPTNTQLNATFAAKIHQRLLRAVDDLGEPGRDPLYGEGRINAGKAVSPATIDALP